MITDKFPPRLPEPQYRLTIHKSDFQAITNPIRLLWSLAARSPLVPRVQGPQPGAGEVLGPVEVLEVVLKDIQIILQISWYNNILADLENP
jgi:hypothetical protein